MKILVVGAAGFIGTHCCNLFSSHHKITGVGITPSLTHEVISDPDFSVTHQLIQQENFDCIVNCAGASNIQESFTNPELDYELNTGLVEKLLDAIRHYSPHTRFINLSSAAVYGNPAHLPVTENTPLNPLSPYGEHKLQAENLIVNSYEKYGVKGAIVRIFSAYGIGLRRQFFYDLSKKFMAFPDQVSLHGSGNESRDFIYVTDIAAALECILNNGKFTGEIYNLAGGQEHFIKDIAVDYARVFGYKGQISFSNQQLTGYPINWVADISKIKSLGFAPSVSLNDGMLLYANWIKSNLNN